MSLLSTIFHLATLTLTKKALVAVGAATGFITIWRLIMFNTGEGIAIAGFFLSAWGTIQAFLKYKLECKAAKSVPETNGLNGKYVSKELFTMQNSHVQTELCRINTKLDDLSNKVTELLTR